MSKQHDMNANFDHELVLDGSAAYALTVFFPVKSRLVLLSRKENVETRVKSLYSATVCPLKFVTIYGMWR